MYEAKVNGKHDFTVSTDDGTFFLNGEEKDLDVQSVNAHSLQVLYQGKSYMVHVEGQDAAEGTVSLRINGKKAEVMLTSELQRLLKKMGLSNMAGNKVSNIKAPMPGLIHSIAVQPGDKVAKGETLLILEAMKMENVIKSPADVEVKKISIEQGQTVDKGQVMMEFA